MSDNRQIVLSAKRAADSDSLCDTHHLLVCLLIELGEPFKPAGEDESHGDFLYFSTQSWSALFKRAARLLGCDDVVARMPSEWSKGDRDLLFNKEFVRKYYKVMADQIAVTSRRAGARCYATDDVFSDANLKTLLHRVGPWGNE